MSSATSDAAIKLLPALDQAPVDPTVIMASQGFDVKGQRLPDVERKA